MMNMEEYDGHHYYHGHHDLPKNQNQDKVYDKYGYQDHQDNQDEDQDEQLNMVIMIIIVIMIEFMGRDDCSHSIMAEHLCSS